MTELSPPQPRADNLDWAKVAALLPAFGDSVDAAADFPSEPSSDLASILPDFHGPAAASYSPPSAGTACGDFFIGLWFPPVGLNCSLSGLSLELRTALRIFCAIYLCLIHPHSWHGQGSPVFHPKDYEKYEIK